LGLLVLLGLWLALRGPSGGELVVTVAGPNSEAIETVQVVVDGRQLCDRSPCALAELTPGTHLVRASAEGYAAAADQAVVIQAGQAAAQNFRLARLVPTAVTVVSPPPTPAAETEPTLDDVPAQPASVPAVAPVAAAVVKTEKATARTESRNSKPVRSAATPAAAAKSSKASGNGTLNITSTPAATVVLDGRPLGRTPRSGVSVPAGSHTVVFVHPQHGRKTVKTQVSAGGTKTVSVRF
jgi:hypothetical protein